MQVLLYPQLLALLEQLTHLCFWLEITCVCVNSLEKHYQTARYQLNRLALIILIGLSQNRKV